MRLAGDLDYESIDELVDTALLLLAQQIALAGLLLIHRRTSHSGVELHLDHRPRFLDRVLQVTGLYGHFVTSDFPAAAGNSTLLSHNMFG
jgi:hypothetical protein